MKKILLTFTLIFSLNISSQIKFEKGYFIKNDNIKIECLINNEDWLNIPNEIEYKITDSSDILKISANDLKAFQIYDTKHYYKKFTFTVDENHKEESENIKNHNTLLRVLVEGEASLYQYNRNIFLFEKNNTINQLLYKKYINNENKVVEDFSYKKELFNNFNCKENPINIRKIRYNKKDLVDFFINYNKCKKSEYKNFSKNKTKLKFNLSPFIGMGVLNKNAEVNLYSPSRTVTIPSIPQEITYPASNEKVKIDFSNQLSLNFGFEAEIILPFNKNKWSVFASPNINFIKGETIKNLDYSNGDSYFKDITLNDFVLVEVPIGVRHYFYLNNINKLQISLAYNFLVNNEKVSFEDSNFTNNPKKDFNLNYCFSIGYYLNKKIDISANYSSSNLNSGNSNSVGINHLTFRIKYKIN